MDEIIAKLPSWYIMLIISVIIGAIIYRLIRYGVTIKAGPVEIDADNPTSEIPKTEEEK